MQSLNSVGDARKALLIAGLGMLIAFLFLAPLVAHAQSPSVTITTDKSAYAGTETITVSGTVSPAPGVSGTNVAVTILSPQGATVDANQFSVNSATGAYTGTFTTGGPLYNVNGTYTITVTAANGATASTSFQYGSGSGVSGVGTTTTEFFSTTVTEQTTVTQAQQTTVTQIQQTTVTVSYTGSDTGTIVGAVGVVIAIVAGALSVVALRKK